MDQTQEIERLNRELENVRAEAVLAVRAAVAAERERCAKRCEDRAASHNGPHVVTLEMNQMARWLRSGEDYAPMQHVRALSADAG